MERPWYEETDGKNTAEQPMALDGGMLTALGYLIIAGAMNSAYTLPLKLKLSWAWENTWLAFTLMGVCVLPVGLGVLTIPNFWSVYQHLQPHLFLILVLSGGTWGIALLLFGLAVDAIGVAITFSVVMGTSAAVGAVLPLLVLHLQMLSARTIVMICMGLVLIGFGVALCGAAGKQRERDESEKIGVPKLAFFRGFLYAVLSGVCGSMLNFGLAAGSPMIEAAKNLGASSRMATNAAWVPVLLAGAIPGIIYCLYLTKRNQSAGNFLRIRTILNWFLAVLMGALWFGSVVLYGWATLQIGDLGAILGWPLFMVTIVLGSVLWGVLTGEWKNARTRARMFMGCAVVTLIVAILVLTGAKAKKMASSCPARPSAGRCALLAAQGGCTTRSQIFPLAEGAMRSIAHYQG